MTRRGLFATLLAPVVAKLMPKVKPKPLGEVIFYLPKDGMFEFGFTGFKQASEPANLYGSNLINRPYWHGRSPCVLVNIKPVPFDGGAQISVPFIYQENS